MTGIYDVIKGPDIILELIIKHIRFHLQTEYQQS